MSVPRPGSRAFRTAWAAFWCRRCSGGAVGGAEGLFEEGDADALGAADVLQGRRGPGLALDHLGEQRQPHRDDLAVLGQPGDRLIQERLAGPAVSSDGLLGQDAVGPAERRQHLAGVQQVEEIDQRPSSRPRRRRISRSRMNRVAAIQKSSRTMTIAWTCSPSHCRRAATSSVSSSLRRAKSHCSNWSRTSSTFSPGRRTRPRRSAASASTRSSAGGQVGAGLAQAPAAAGPRSPRASPRRRPAARPCASRGSKPALTSDDLPQPDGP